MSSPVTPECPEGAARRRLGPHRPFFALGLAVLALSGLWWSLALLSRWRGWAMPWALSPGLAHGLLFGLGAMPLFVSGFFFTVAPRWLGPGGPEPRRRAAALLPAALGLVLLLAGVHLAFPLAGLGVLLMTASWALSWWQAGQLLAASAAPDRLHLRCLHAAWLLGVGAMALTGLALLEAQEAWAGRGLQAALWWSLLPIFLTALHRMVPFFAEPAACLQRRSSACAPICHAAPGSHGPGPILLWMGLAACAWGGAWQVLRPSAVPDWAGALRAIGEGVAALLLLSQAWHWRRMIRLPLMAMLLCGGLWLAAGAGLWALSSGLQAAGMRGLGLAPLHAVMAGGLASLMMAQVSRVSSGHAGRARAVDRPLMALFVMLQAAVLLRLWAALRTPEPDAVLVLASLLWCLAMAGWALRLMAWLRQGAAV